VLTADRAREVLAYDPITGFLTWKVTLSNRAVAGRQAGAKSDCGRLNVSIDGRRYKAHRACWLIYYGRWPNGEVDHIDCDQSNNVISNLREATGSENGANKRLWKRNKTGVKGVHWAKCNNMWVAEVFHKGERVFQRYFHSFEDAKKARESAFEDFYGEFARHG
jgi:hypothetical protein